MATKWIFFDVGSTLVDETEAYDHRARDMITGTNIIYILNYIKIQFALTAYHCHVIELFVNI